MSKRRPSRPPEISFGLGEIKITINAERVQHFSLDEAYQAASLVGVVLGKTRDVDKALNELDLTGLPERELLYDALSAGLSKQRERKFLREGSREKYEVIKGVVEQLKPLFPWYREGKESRLLQWGYRERRS